jgi:tetratricopeptide (TPR) repeat protein/O-antigen ligase
MRHRVRLLGLVLLFTCLLFFAESAYGSKSLGLRVLGRAALVGPLVVYLVGLVRNGKGIPRTPLDGPLLAWLGAAVVATVAGLSPRYSLETLWPYAVYVLGFWLFTDARGTRWEHLVLTATFMTAGIVCLVALTEWASWYLGLPLLPGVVAGWPELGGWTDPIPPYFYRLNMTLGGATPLSAYVALIIPPCLGWTLTAKSKDGRWAGGLLLSALVLVEVLAFSRGGLLALAVSLPITAAAWATGSPDSLRSIRRWAAQRRGLLAGMLIVAVALALVVGGLWVWNSFAGREHSTRFRLTLWQAALEVASRRPLTGAGPGNFGRALLFRNDSALPRSQIATAHSLYLNTAAEMGLAGLVAGGWLCAVAVLTWIRRWRSSVSEAERVRVGACGAALAGLAAQQLVDTFYGPAQVLPLLVLAAAALVPASPGSERRSRPGWAGVGLALLLLLATWLAWTSLALYHLQRSVRQADNGEFQEAVAEADVAQRMDGRLAINTFQLAYAEALSFSVDGAAGMAEAAIDDYQAALALDPVWGTNTANLASLLWETGSSQAAVEWMLRTVDVEPDALHLLNLGLYYEQMGQLDEAWDSYAQSLVEQPGLAGSGFWGAEESRAAAWPEIVSRAESRLGGYPTHSQACFRAQVAWARGDLAEVADEALTIVGSAPEWAEGHLWLARSLLAQGRAPAAVDAAETAVSLDRERSDTHGLLGCALAASGDVVQGEAELRLALFMRTGGREEAYACLAELYRAEGDIQAAVWAYERAVAPRAVSQDVEMTLYGRLVGFDLLPGFVRIRMGEREAEPWLRLGDLYEQEGMLADARRVYLALLSQDPHLDAAQDRLDALEGVE